MEFDRKDIQMNKLVTTCLESKIHVYDLRTQHPTNGFASLSEKVFLTDFYSNVKYVTFTLGVKIMTKYQWNILLGFFSGT